MFQWNTLPLAAEAELVRLAVLIHHHRVGHDHGAVSVRERGVEAQVEAHVDYRAQRADDRGNF